MSDITNTTAKRQGAKVAGLKETGAAKTARIPIKIVPQPAMRKPEWIRMKVPDSARFQEIKQVLRDNKLHTVCEEASCPNIGECFSGGTATFMVLGDNCIREVRTQSPEIKIEILVPDFRGRLDRAMEILTQAPPDVMNHNLETVPRLYKEARPGSDYHNSLQLLKAFGEQHPQVPTKSGLMLGIGETDDEILQVMQDLRDHGVTMLTLGQYLQPSPHHLPVKRFVEPAIFKEFEAKALAMGFTHAACGPMVRSSYHADQQAHSAGV
jgi:lipoic acid synthetase